ncbi:MAG TPA: apolipoprotein N-acyltransferase [Novosphingobium sp.]|nr:apolipoprotein N-acyltransferase [Novosphingobium sp.]
MADSNAAFGASSQALSTSEAGVSKRQRTLERLRIFRARAWAVAWPALLLAGIGAVAALGFRPWALWPFTLAGVAALIWAVMRANTALAAGFAGWFWAIGHFAAGNNWIATAFTYQAKMPVWLGAVAVLVLSLYLAIWPALAAAGAWALRRHAGARVLGFAGLWIVTEWMRAWVISGFAWNPLGVALLGDFAHPGLAVLAPWIGTYGLSGLAVLLAGLLAEGSMLLLAGERARGAALAAAPLVLVGVAMVWPSPAPVPGHVPFTLIQPNIAQADLDDPTHFEQQFMASARLSTPRDARARLVLWPESGVPEYMRDGYPRWYYEFTFAGDPWLQRLRLARVIGPAGLLLTGSVDLDLKGSEAVGGQNVVTALDGHGNIAGSYAKAHLVPFGEYLPLRAWLKPLGLERLVPGDIDFRAGPGPRTLDFGPLGRAGFQICYEIIFSGEVIDRAHRPDYIVNPSNDGWFGDWGPPQHLAQARLRAVEEGVPVLRSTTNGISAVVDARGVVRASAPRDVAMRIDGMVPAALPPTLFARFGNMVPLGLAVVFLGLAGLVFMRRRG